MIVGIPSNDFGGQEPGGATEIAETAQHQYGVTFPIAAKAIVKGANAHPFYKWAAEARPKDVPRWNFHNSCWPAYCGVKPQSEAVLTTKIGWPVYSASLISPPANAGNENA